ncbi:MAG: DUF493 family protein [Bacteroidetes bacterium]|jgi:putative lipoic acid-binding regulatory protein|nr:DUF493 family protein [Bacteroidota bacterium]
MNIQPSQAKGEAWWDDFRELLDDQNDWPTQYTFKFIAAKSELEALKALFGNHPVRIRNSSKGNYVSVTARLRMESSEEIVNVYKSAGDVEGVIAL